LQIETVHSVVFYALFLTSKT